MKTNKKSPLALFALLSLANASSAFASKPVVACDQDCLNRLNGRLDKLETEVHQIKLANRVPIGALLPYAGGPIPEHFLPADGRRLDDRDPQFVSLCQALGDRFKLANDAQGTCRLPDLRGRGPIGGGQGEGLTERKLGELLGEESHQMSVEELAKHDHHVTDPGHRHNFITGTNTGRSQGIYGPAGNGGPSPDFIDTTTTGITVDARGESKPFNVMQPSVVVNFLVKY